ncbi:9916_t:CDS:2 [Dentiscutata erythropus]|uniref:9916_t:CDS:1 n=1 Tax=Dentiscutata erythropus TaxID=1348616 RepID=A0A9N9N6M2_9GLOM|nr:9916_t:CDS:2 [Dentiscutata erythropus]
MSCSQTIPEEFKKRNGIINYINFMKDLFPSELAFPVKENCLKEYLTRQVEKVEAGNLQARQLAIGQSSVTDRNQFNIQESATPNDARSSLSHGINTSNINSLPTGIDFYTQLQSEQYYTHSYNIKLVKQAIDALGLISNAHRRIVSNHLSNSHINMRELIREMSDAWKHISEADKKFDHLFRFTLTE